MPQAAAPPRAARRLQTVRTFGRWDCINARQRERAKESRFAACASLLTSPATRRRRQSAGLFAYSRFTAETDWLLEGDGFELPVPRARTTPGSASCALPGQSNAPAARARLERDQAAPGFGEEGEHCRRTRDREDGGTAKAQERDGGRDAHYWAPPAQNRTGSFPAYGSHLGCLTAGLGLPYALRRR